MTITFNDMTYDVALESIYSDFSVYADSLDDACRIVNFFDGMNSYTFNNIAYDNMVVTKRTIIIEDTGIRVKIMLRKKTDAEIAREELDALRTAITDLAGTVSKTNAAKLNKVLADTKGAIE